jgi:hypothetical protein
VLIESVPHFRHRKLPRRALYQPHAKPLFQLRDPAAQFGLGLVKRPSRRRKPPYSTTFTNQTKSLRSCINPHRSIFRTVNAIFTIYRDINPEYKLITSTEHQELIMKNITGVYTAPRQHWVGDGFPVRSMFSYQTHGEPLSPFLLLDYAGPYTFPADGAKRGVGQHPHRGFETVTLVYSGEVEHRDSTGKAASLAPATCSG